MKQHNHAILCTKTLHDQTLLADSKGSTLRIWSTDKIIATGSPNHEAQASLTFHGPAELSDGSERLKDFTYRIDRDTSDAITAALDALQYEADVVATSA